MGITDEDYEQGEIMRASRNQTKLNKLHECVGDEKFTELLNMFSGDNVYFSPSGDIISRNAHIRADYDDLIRQGEKSGIAVELLCMKYDLSKATIYAILPQLLPK